MARSFVTRDNYLPKGAMKVADKASDAVAYVYTSNVGRPSAAVFLGKQSKPVFHWCFRSGQAREKAITDAFAARRAAAAAKKAR
jgi:hypothetical protein